MRRPSTMMDPPLPPGVSLEALRGELHARIDRLEAMIRQPRDPMDEIRTLAAVPAPKAVTVQELRARGYTALQVMLARVEGLSTLPAVVDGGYKWADLVDAGRSERSAAAACLKEGIPVATLVEIGAPLAVLASAAVTGGNNSSLLQELISAGATVRGLAEAGASVSALMKCGVSAQTLLQSGVAVDRLVEAGVAPKTLVEQCGVKLGSFVLPMGTRIALTTFSYVQRKDLTIQGGGPREYSICWVVEGGPGAQGRQVRTETMGLEYMLRNGLKLV